MPLNKNPSTEVNKKPINSEFEQLKQDILEQSIITKLESKIPKYNVRLCKKIETTEYTFKGKGDDLSLNIEINSKNLNKIGDVLIELFNVDIRLYGDIIARRIYEADFKLPESFENIIISSEDSSFSKNEIEELFVFVNTIKEINIEDWDIPSSICVKNIDTPECRNALGSPKRYGFYEAITKKE